MNKITMRKLCLIFTLAMIPTLGISQFIGDSVIVYVNDRVEINLAVPDYDDLHSTGTEVAALKEFQDLIPQFINELSTESADLVSYTIGGPLTIEPGDPKKIYLYNNGELTNTGVRDKAIITDDDFKIIITATDLSVLIDMPLATCLQSVIEELPEKKNWSRSLYYECKDGDVKELETRNNQVDFLEFNIGAGAGLYKSTLVPDLTLGLGIGFNRKGLLRYPYVSSNILFTLDPEDISNTNIHSFINFGYGWSINKRGNKNDMISVELGYLVLNGDDIFDEDTFKFGVNWSPGKSIVVSPNIFYNHFHKDIFTGIRVGFGF